MLIKKANFYYVVWHIQQDNDYMVVQYSKEGYVDRHWPGNVSCHIVYLKTVMKFVEGIHAP